MQLTCRCIPSNVRILLLQRYGKPLSVQLVWIHATKCTQWDRVALRACVYFRAQIMYTRAIVQLNLYLRIGFVAAILL